MLLKKSGGSEARDPCVIYHNGCFYHCFTKDSKEIRITRSLTLKGLLYSPETVVFRPEEGTEYSKELWAPELHVIGGKCYIYVACDDGNNYNHRMYVLANGSADPLRPYRMAGKLCDATDKWAIDGTVFRFGGKLYTAWSGWEGDENVCQNLYIAEMRDPLTVSSERFLISRPEKDWEKIGCTGRRDSPFINEGPCAYIKDGKLRIIFSASSSWYNGYNLAILEFLGGDIFDKSRWKKSDWPALSLADGFNGPGHCSVFTFGPRDYIAFHVFDDGKTEGWHNVHAEIHAFRIERGKIVIREEDAA